MILLFVITYLLVGAKLVVSHDYLDRSSKLFIIRLLSTNKGKYCLILLCIIILPLTGAQFVDSHDYLNNGYVLSCSSLD